MTDYEKAYRDLRAAMEALADELLAKGRNAGYSPGYRLGVRSAQEQLRALLAPAPASETARGWCSVCYEAHPTCIPTPPLTTMKED